MAWQRWWWDKEGLWFHVEAEYENNNFLTRSGENGLAEVEEVDSSETLACADDAHKADVYTYSHSFFESRSYWDTRRWFWGYSLR